MKSVYIPVSPNRGIEADYRKRLESLVREMHDSIVYFVIASYRKHTPVMAQDASPTSFIARALNKLIERWQRRFNSVSKELATRFVGKVNNTTSITFTEAAKKAGMTVKFTMTPLLQDAYSAAIEENVGLIKSIASEHLAEVQGLVMRSVQAGRSMKELTDELVTRYGITRRRAALIARDQNNKATSVMNAAKQIELMGDDAEATWKHSAAGKHPRPEHVAANGKTYKVKQGMFLEGKWTWPGREINCRCTSSLIIKGYPS